jgi:hypothetical protein
MSLDKAIAHGKEKRRTYEQRGKPGRFDATCRPHGSCPYCQRARLFHAAKEAAEVRDQMAHIDEPVIRTDGGAMTMGEMYGDGSSHEACQDCGRFKCCGDCQCSPA